MTTMSSVRNNSGNGGVLLLLFVTIAALTFFLGKVLMGFELLAPSNSKSPEWKLSPVTQAPSEAVVAGWLAAFEKAVWQAAPEGSMPDLFDPNSFCNKHDIQSLTGSPCIWLKEVSFDQEGNISYRHTLKSGEHEIAKVELQELKVSEYKELTEVSKYLKMGSETGWFEYVEVAEWTRGLGLGKTIWHALNKWTAIMSGGQALRIVADTSEVKWIPNMLKQAIDSNLITNVYQVGKQMWVFVSHQ